MKLHALGYYHEQNRPDRDKYITIAYKNVDDAFVKQFEKLSPVVAATADTQYDYGSSMQSRFSHRLLPFHIHSHSTSFNLIISLNLLYFITNTYIMYIQIKSVLNAKHSISNAILF